jgi:molybdenum cofactor biosynthesis enzyme MoaA
MVKRIHISLTNICNSVCKLCDRHLADEPLGSQLSKKQIDNLFTPKTLEHLNNVAICGNTGEPTLGKNLLYIIKKIHDEKGESVKIHINTNGDTHPEQWWRELAQMHKNMLVTFCIEGMSQETHEKYRSTYRDNVWRNMLTFKKAGGTAIWQFIVFKHNQDDVPWARRLAKKYDIKLVLARSRRYGPSNLDKNDILEEPTIDLDMERLGASSRRHRSEDERKENPVCSWLHDEIFVRSDGYLRVCCYRDYQREKGLNLSDHTTDEILNSNTFRKQVSLIGLVEPCSRQCKEYNEDVACQKIGELLLSNKNERIENLLLKIRETESKGNG